MNAKVSAGLLMYSFASGELKFFLVHPGGPYFKNKDNGFWSIPKGLLDNDEKPLDAAKREFNEETGLTAENNFLPLGTVKQKNNKTVYAWAFESGLENPIEITCNTFEMEWPPRTGNMQSFTEVDRGKFFSFEEATIKIIPEQKVFLTRVKNYLNDIKR